jgi:hypothetical protein
MRQILCVGATAAIVLGLLAAPVTAERQTFPGANGPLVFGFGATLVTQNADGSNRRTIVSSVNGVAAYEPAWSADGTKIVFENKLGGNGGIYIVNADGSGLTRVTRDVNDEGPTFAPDGRRIAFITVSAGRKRLGVVNIDGTGLAILTPTLDRSLDDPEWSPDGTRIAFSDFADIYVVNADGSNLRDLTSSPSESARADNPSWSPDSSRIAYAYASANVKVVNADGSGSTTIVPNPGEVWEVAWSPDGQKIAFVNDANGPLQEELFIVNPDGSGVIRPGIDVSTTLDWGVVAAAPPVPPPAVGVNVNVTPVSGVVRVRPRGTATFVDLAALQSLPVGSEIDVTRGRIRLVSAASGSQTQTADFYQGRAVIGQTRGATPLTTLKLSGPLTCPKRKSSGAAAPKRRHIWGNGVGSFQTKGKFASATVRGTVWLTEDRCDATLVRVSSGRVLVFDQVRRRQVTVNAGQSYLARRR